VLFGNFMVNELLPWVYSRYRVLPEAANHATLGASDGGNIALWLGYRYSSTFGRVAAQSSNVSTEVSSGLQTGAMLPLQFYLDIGTYDIDVLIPLVHNLRAILDQRGYTYRYHEFHEGHSWGNWRAHMKYALEMFFPGDSVTVLTPTSAVVREFGLTVYPNPFNARTTIAYDLPRTEHVRLRVFDVTGRLVRILEDSAQEAGLHEVGVDSAGLASGLYFVAMETREVSICRKIVLLK
jgi:hypothetical protein